MRPSRWPLATAVAFAGLLALAAVTPIPPGVTATGAVVVAYYRAHHDAVALQAWLTMAATLPGALLVAYAARQMTDLARTAFIIAAATTVTLLGIGLLLRLGLARHPNTLDSGTARALADIEAYWSPLLTFPVITQSLAIIYCVRDGSFPKWLGVISAVLALEQLAETATVFGTNGAFAPGGELNSLLGPALYLFWIVALGTALSRAPRAAQPVTEPGLTVRRTGLSV